MRKQFLYVGKPGFYYSGPGNIRIGPGSQGTVFFWFHASPDYPSWRPLWKAVGDSNNYLRFGVFGADSLGFECRSGGTSWWVSWPNYPWRDRNHWMPVTCTWDFTTPGAGQLRVYVNGVEAPAQVNNASAPVVEAAKLYLGPGATETAEAVNGCYDNFAVWDGVMTKAQHDAILGGANSWATRQNRRRRLIRESDGTGQLTLLATFDGSYDAEIAGGDATAYWEVGSADWDEFCRLDDGSRARGVRHHFNIGMPRHDNTPDDRVPLQAVLTPITHAGASAYTTLTNHARYGQVQVSQLYGGSSTGQGVGWLREWINPFHMACPATIRMRVNCPAETNPVGTQITLGPLCYVAGGQLGNNFGTWGTGELFAVVADAGNTASRFKTNLPNRGDGYWVGAELTMRTGAQAGCRLKVTGYTAATGVITVSGALAGVPAAGDKGVVDHRGRLLASATPLNEQQNLEAWLWESYSTDRPWLELECVYSADKSTTLVRYERGRSALMTLTNYRSDPLGRYMMFGRSISHPVPASYQCDIRLESLTIEGPGGYQTMAPEDSALGRGFELGDSFLVRDVDTGQSSRVWRQEGVVWRSAKPVVDPDPAGVEADLRAAGTWRHTAELHSVVQPQELLDRVTVLVGGTDPGGVWRGGYLVGTWDATRSRVSWADETPPAGRQNPFLSPEDVRPWSTRDATWGLESPGIATVLGMPDGSWTMLQGGTEANPDHYWIRALVGAQDRWSFDWEKHWWTENPLLPGMGGTEKLSADGGSICLWGNRDADWMVAHNPYASRPERRFVGYSRFKTMLMSGDYLSYNRRPLAGWTSGDLRSFFLLPHGNLLSPLAAADLYELHTRPVSDDFTTLYVLSFGSYLRLWATEDDRHFQPVDEEFLAGGPVRTSFLLGDKLVLYYYAGTGLNMAHIGRDRETYYELAAGAVTGFLETPVLQRPSSGWSRLLVNCEPGAGSVRVEVIDPRTEEPLAGFGAEDCDVLGPGVEQVVSWGGVSLNHVTAEEVRLRFVLQRPLATDVSPSLYAWYAAGRDAVGAPTATELRVEGQINPTGITDLTPALSWRYSDPQGKPQTAYQVLVASSAELLAANTGDIWDSGVVASPETEVEFGGPELSDDTTYFWKVRVRNSEGVWSETW